MQIGELPPDESALAVDRAGAIEAARQLGLEEGIAPWSVRLRGDGGRSWLWVVTNTEFDDGSGFRGGRSLSISTETGELLEEVRWEVTP